MLESDARIAAKAVADLVAAKLEQNAAEAAPREPRPHPFTRVRSAIADYQARVTEGTWPSHADKASVREIAKAAEAPADIVRHILRHPDCSIGGTK
ncbi:hypothetical protein OE647_01125 [Defluviimonas sp. WL0075]|uniref:Uncharacterized protein n=2 Tax=Albidovulum sediminicola TaxID=2984331 RepID=A0ABT2YWY6_9RHOB|nr:hypothetical protein [Defluviimonas sp. WL0075]